MAIAYVKGSGKRTKAGANSDSYTFGSNVTANNLLIVTSGSWHDPAPGAPVITAPGYSFATDRSQLESTAVHTIAAIASGLVPSTASPTITITPTHSDNGDYWAWSVDEFSGLATASWLDQTGAATNVTSTSITVTAAGANANAAALAVSVMGDNSAHVDCGISDPPSGYSSLYAQQNSSTVIGTAAAYKVESGLVTSSSAWTVANADNTCAVIATYKVAGGGGGGGFFARRYYDAGSVNV